MPCMCTSALMRDRKRGHMRLTTLPACGLDHNAAGDPPGPENTRTSAFVRGAYSPLLRGRIAKKKVCCPHGAVCLARAEHWFKRDRSETGTHWRFFFPGESCLIRGHN